MWLVFRGLTVCHAHQSMVSIVSRKVQRGEYGPVAVIWAAGCRTACTVGS